MSSASASSQAPPDANKPIRDHVIHYRSRPGIDLRPGCTNCGTLDRLVQLIPAEWTWTRDKNDCHREGLEQLIASDGHKIDLLEAKINLEDVYGSEDFRMKMGLGDLDVSGKGVWVTKGLLTAWIRLLNRYMEKGTWTEITDKPKLEVYKPIDRQFSDEIGYTNGYTNDGTVDEDVKLINSTLPDKEHWHLSRPRDTNKRLLESSMEHELDIVVGGKRGCVCPQTYDGRWWTKDLLQAHTKAKTKACKDDEEKRFTEEKIRLWMKDLHVAENRVSDV
ncbi:hypothetical protein J4E80_005499 [Alternaria sp. BMP 0032]|nr:hypothetical protein J4E80_005499 [Alternaria sp. BMP 0032]